MQNWENCDRTFLVTIHNISSSQKHTTFRTPINSTTIHVITQVNSTRRKVRNLGFFFSAADAENPNERHAERLRTGGRNRFDRQPTSTADQTATVGRRRENLRHPAVVDVDQLEIRPGEKMRLRREQCLEDFH